MITWCVELAWTRGVYGLYYLKGPHKDQVFGCEALIYEEGLTLINYTLK